MSSFNFRFNQNGKENFDEKEPFLVPNASSPAKEDKNQSNLFNNPHSNQNGNNDFSPPLILDKNMLDNDKSYRYNNHLSNNNKVLQNSQFWDKDRSDDLNDADDESAPSLIRMIIAAVGLMITAGIAWFAYNWIKSPSSDTPPLIHAESNEYKVKPDQPGGIDIPHQNKLIYGRIATNNQNDPQPVENLLPPPEQPMNIEEQNAQDNPEQHPSYPANDYDNRSDYNSSAQPHGPQRSGYNQENYYNDRNGDKFSPEPVPNYDNNNYRQSPQVNNAPHNRNPNYYEPNLNETNNNQSMGRHHNQRINPNEQPNYYNQQDQRHNDMYYNHTPRQAPPQKNIVDSQAPSNPYSDQSSSNNSNNYGNNYQPQRPDNYNQSNQAATYYPDRNHNVDTSNLSPHANHQNTSHKIQKTNKVDVSNHQPKTTANNNYYLNMGTFNNENQAVIFWSTASRKFNLSQYNNTIKENKINGKNAYTLLVGPFSEKTSALKLAVTLQNKGMQNVKVIGQK